MRDRLRVFGIDIIKGSVRSRSRRPMYALIRMEGQVIESESEVLDVRLFRMLNEENRIIPAVDSLQEIAVDQHDLFFFLQALPPRKLTACPGYGRRTERDPRKGRRPYITSVSTALIRLLKPARLRRLPRLGQAQRS